MWPFIWGAGSDVDRIDSPETVEMLKFYQTMVENQYMSTEVVNYNSGDNANQFIAGKTAMIIDGPWRLSSIQADAALNLEWPRFLREALGLRQCWAAIILPFPIRVMWI